MMFSKVISTFGVLTLAFAAISVAQQTPINPIPRYTVIRPTTPVDIAAQQALAARGAAIQTWTGSFTYQGVKHPYTMVGTDPSKGSATTTLKMVIIPLAVKFSTQTFDPTKPIQPACGTGTAIKLTEEIANLLKQGHLTSSGPPMWVPRNTKMPCNAPSSGPQ